jgi:hypothetical protein
MVIKALGGSREPDGPNRAAMTTDSLVFVSYSRNDYYFAESLASHLSRRGIRAWLDVRDLTPGALWERDLETALDAATCVILVATPESLRRPNVQKEWRYADKRGKRIIVAQCRGLRLCEELVGCERVDFRGAFAPALDQLIALLQQHPEAGSALERGRQNRIVLPLPPWIIAISLALVIPLIRCGVLSSSWKSALQSAIVGSDLRKTCTTGISIRLETSTLVITPSLAENQG